MIKDNSPYLIEFNVRMGDPESNYFAKVKAVIRSIFILLYGNLHNLKIDFEDKKHLHCSVLKGYPDKIKKRMKLKNLVTLFLKNYFIFMLELSCSKKKFYQTVEEC